MIKIYVVVELEYGDSELCASDANLTVYATRESAEADVIRRAINLTDGRGEPITNYESAIDAYIENDTSSIEIFDEDVHA